MSDDNQSENPCDDCLLKCEPLEPRIRKNARFLVVNKQTSGAMNHKGQHVTTAALKKFAKHMKRAGFDRSDFSFVNTVRCGYNPQGWRTVDNKVIKKACRRRLAQTIHEVQPEVVISLGADAATAVHGRAVKISKARGVMEYLPEFNCYSLPIMDPSYVHLYPQHEPVFASDCKTLERAVEYDYDLESASRDMLGDYKQIYDLQFLVDMEPKVLAFDIETVGTRWQESHRKIMTLQFCVKPGEAYMLSWDHPDDPLPRRVRGKVKKQLKQLLRNPKTSVIGQGNKFDALWILRDFKFRYRINHDTLIMAALIDENQQPKDLDTLTKIYAPEMAGYADVFNATYDKERMDLVPLEKLLEYGPGDVDASLRIYKAMRPLLKEDSMLWTNYRKVAMAGINAFVAIESRGMPIDEDALDEFERVLSEYVADLQTKLLDQVPASIKKLHIDKGIRFSRPDFVRDVLFYHEDGFKLKPKVYTESTEKLDPEFRVPSTSSKDHLPYFFQTCPFTVDLAEWMKLDRLLGTNVIRFRENYITDGSIYPVYSISTAVTGRTASSDPNGQNFPNKGEYGKAYKKIFVPPEGKVIAAADLSQAELRIAGDMAGDREMLRIYNTGGDIHKHTACIVMGVSMAEFDRIPKKERDMARFKAKAVNFGFLYGMGWRKFIVYAKTQYGVDFTDDEAQRIRLGFFRKYKALQPWHNAIREFVRNNGYVRAYDGRIRHLPMIWSDDEKVVAEASRQAINSPVQCFGSNLGVMSFSRMESEIDDRYLAVNGFVHDAIYTYTDPQYVEWAARTLKWYMESNPLEEWFGRKMKLPIVADVGFGWNGRDLYEMGDIPHDRPYDFQALAEREKATIELPPQEIPPNNGRRTERLYAPLTR